MNSEGYWVCGPVPCDASSPENTTQLTCSEPLVSQQGPQPQPSVLLQGLLSPPPALCFQDTPTRFWHLAVTSV